MAVWQIESGACTGRGFADVDADGICSKFYSYITKLPAAGGPGWTILRDKSTVADTTVKNFDPADVSNPGGEITETAHGYVTGDRVILSTTGTLPSGWYETTYYVIKTGANTFKISSSLANAYAGTNITVSSQGTGVHSVVLEGPYIIVSDNASPAINEVCFVMKIGYLVLEAGYIRVQHFLGWDDTNKIAIGVWDGRRVESVDAGPFAYDFRGGTQGMIVQSRIGTDWDTAGIDTFTGSTNFLESASVVTDLTAQGTAGSSVNLAVTSSTGFNANSYYFIYDLTTEAIVNYVKCTVVPDGSHITVETLYDTFPIGAVIGAYPHRFYTFGTAYQSSLYDMNNSASLSKIPYCSGDDGHVFHDQGTVIYGSIKVSSLNSAIETGNPGDDGYFAVQKAFICEYFRENSSSSQTGMNRPYGITNNVYLTSNTSLAQAQDGRTIGGSNYLYFQSQGEAFSSGDGYPAVLILDTESLS
jgi:hypothetical protein